MHRLILVIAAASALILAGCGTSSEPAPEAPATVAPTPEAAAPPAAPEPKPAPVDDDADADAELGSLPAGQSEACADMLPFFASGRDTAGWNPDTAAEQIVESMSGSPEWNAASESRRQSIAAGIRQAAAGSCT